MKWIPVEEKYPPHSSYLLVMADREVKERKVHKIFIAHYRRKDVWFIVCNDLLTCTPSRLEGKVTHWMHLPERP